MAEHFSDPVFDKVLDISTLHVSMKDAKYLQVCCQGYCDEKLIVTKLDRGYLVYVPTIEGPRGQSGDEYSELKLVVSSAFIHIFAEAKNKGFTYIKFDGDGVVYDDLEVFYWE
jgi:hypothetical protein